MLDKSKAVGTIPPGPSGSFFFGSLFDLQKDNLGTLCRAAEVHGDCTQLRAGPLKVLLVTRPEYVRHVLLENSRNYTKKSFAYRHLRAFFGDGLIFNEGGDPWLRKRRLAQPAFHLDRLKSFVEKFNAASNALLARWGAGAPAAVPVSILPEMMKITLQVVGQTLLSRDLLANADGVEGALSVLLKECDRRTRVLSPFAEFLPTGWNRRVRRARQELDRLIYSLIAERRRAGDKKNDDLLALYTEAIDLDTGLKMTDREVRDEVMSIFIAGHETTANALTWFWYLLSLNPPVEMKVRQEIEQALHGRSPCLEDFPKLKYTECAFLETLRMYPPVWLIARQSTSADRLGPFIVPKGRTVFLSPYITQRDPKLWPNPTTFDPSRFAKEAGAPGVNFDYFPFAGGPRACIGQRFAVMEAVTVIARVLQNFHLRRVSPATAEPDSSITLRPKHPILFSITKLPRE